MHKVAVFGNAGGGKSTLAKKLSEILRLPLYPLDQIQFDVGGIKVPHEKYLEIHSQLLAQDEWIIDGYGCNVTLWERLMIADTLIYVDLPVLNHYLWVTKRLIKGQFATPEGWPNGSPVWSSSMDSYRVISLCHQKLTPKYRQFVLDSMASKRVHHLKSPRQIREFLSQMRNEHSTL